MDLLNRRSMLISGGGETPLVSFDGVYTAGTAVLTVTDGNHFYMERTSNSWSHQYMSIERSDGEPWFTVPIGETLTMVSPGNVPLGYAHHGFVVAKTAFDMNGWNSKDSNYLVGKYGNVNNDGNYRGTWVNNTGADVPVMAINFRCGGNGSKGKKYSFDLILEINGTRIV